MTTDGARHGRDDKNCGVRGWVPAEARRLRYDDGREAVQEELSSTRRTARIVGMLVLGGYLTYGVGNAIATGIAAAPDYLSSVSTSTLFTASAVWMLLNSALVIGIGALMLPILRPHNKNIALGYFATRVFEGIILAVGVISLLSLVIVSRSYTEAGAADASYFGTLGALAINGNFMAYNVAMVGLGLGSLFFCYLLFRSNLVPRFWRSGASLDTQSLQPDACWRFSASPEPALWRPSRVVCSRSSSASG